MNAAALSRDLSAWRAHRGAPGTDVAELQALLARLRAWKAQHDRERAGQPGPFLKMAWDGVYGDDDGAVTEAIGELEAALGVAPGGEG